jgi:urea-proton symporter
VTAGLVLPYAARGLLGTGGALASFFLVFFAVTSAYSSELIAVSSIFTYDIYQTYINPKASGTTLIRISHASCIGFALFMSCFGVGLYHAGVGMGYLYLMMGVVISSAVIPATLTLIWKDMNWIAAACSPVLGLATSLTAWLVTATRECGSLSVSCTGSNYPMLAGNVAALLSPLIFVPVLTYSFGRQNYDWESMKQITRGDDSEMIRRASADASSVNEYRDYTNDEQDQKHLMRAAKLARWMTVGMTLVFLILWPMPLYGSGYVFSKPFFTGESQSPHHPFSFLPHPFPLFTSQNNTIASLPPPRQTHQLTPSFPPIRLGHSRPHLALRHDGLRRHLPALGVARHHRACRNSHARGPHREKQAGGDRARPPRPCRHRQRRW